MMTKRCECGTLNREEAKFCKHCGTALEVTKDKDYSDFFGKEDVLPLIESFKTRAKAARQLKRLGTGVKVGIDCLILGDSGTGKSFLTGKLYGILLQSGLVSESKPEVVDASDFQKWMDTFDDNLQKAKDGVLVITNAQKLVPDGVSSDVNELDRLFNRMKNTQANIPIVFLVGLRRGMEEFLEKNPDAASLFEFRFDLKPLDEKSLCSICKELLEDNFKLSLAYSAKDRLSRRFEWISRSQGAAGNGHEAEKVAQEAGLNAILRNSKQVEEQDITGEVFTPRTEEAIMADLDGFIGMENVKNEIRSIIDALKEAKRTGEKARIEDHYVFTGNPGTGKTTIARMFAEILGAVGALPKGQFIELAGKDLISDVVGGSERNVQEAVDKAMGGVLFIDEAYGLNDGQFGQAAIDKLLPIVENRRGDFVCILAGYTKEMRDFMKANSGLESRFNKKIDFPDYNPEELERIFRSMAAKKGLTLDDEASGKLRMEMEKMYNRRTDNFGNARDVRNRLRQADDRRKARNRGRSEAELAAEGKLLTYSDIAGQQATEEIKLEEVMSELDALVGLDSVKRQVKRLAASVRREQMLSLTLSRTPNVPMQHYLFLGNPGTGKTTVARLMGKIFHSLGLLPRADVTEVLRKDLVGRFMGDTAQLTKEAVMDAMGGVLFIDEAYSLKTADNDSYGAECINTLVPLLENYKGKFICIAAGYTKEMRSFLQANSGMRSRFPKSGEIIFEDYSAEDLHRIFLLNCKKEKLILSSGADAAVKEKLQKMYDERGGDFGNAREVRNLIDEVKNNISERTMFLESATTEQLQTILAEDVK